MGQGGNVELKSIITFARVLRCAFFFSIKNDKKRDVLHCPNVTLIATRFAFSTSCNLTYLKRFIFLIRQIVKKKICDLFPNRRHARAEWNEVKSSR